MAGETRPRFRRVRSHFVSSINSDHQQRSTPQRIRSVYVCARRYRARQRSALLAHFRIPLPVSSRATATTWSRARARYARYSLLPKCRDYARDRNRDSPGPALRIAEYRLSRGYCRRCLGGIPNRVSTAGSLSRGACSFTQAAVAAGTSEESQPGNYRERPTRKSWSLSPVRYSQERSAIARLMSQVDK